MSKRTDIRIIDIDGIGNIHTGKKSARRFTKSPSELSKYAITEKNVDNKDCSTGPDHVPSNWDKFNPV